MFRELNQLSQLMYEGRKGLGRMVLAKADDPNIDYLLRLKTAVPFTQTRWVRKLLQMATSKAVLGGERRDGVEAEALSKITADQFEALDGELHNRGT
ncbi:hypothetical protein [Sphingomonas sp.]|uniref:hypothetical protein n=1 Tax=unclassified Sphingomonas TaxID=196159 RepID=UPI003435593D